uniref:Aminotransferase class I/classII large domain-containing protein n=1 Tax=Naja naja TaxID=35670 RepID=A0A8C6XJJ2_NAJNA
MLNVLKQGNQGSCAMEVALNVDLHQTFSNSTEMGEQLSEKAKALQLGQSRMDSVTKGLLPCHPADSQSSPYLSVRANMAVDSMFSRKVYQLYLADKYDEDKNPSGIINFAVSENKLCFDLMSKKLTQSATNLTDPSLLQYPDWNGHMFAREEVARFLTHYSKASVPLKTENVILQNGCGSLFSSLAMVLCDPGEAFLIATPFYGTIIKNVHLYGRVKLVYAYLDSQVTGSCTRPFQLTVDKLKKGLQDARSEVNFMLIQFLLDYSSGQDSLASLNYFSKPWLSSAI